eukprot:1785636-Prymnesium_polylepis.1
MKESKGEGEVRRGRGVGRARERSDEGDGEMGKGKVGEKSGERDGPPSVNGDAAHLERGYIDHEL